MGLAPQRAPPVGAASRETTLREITQRRLGYVAARRFLLHPAPTTGGAFELRCLGSESSR